MICGGARGTAADPTNASCGSLHAAEANLIAHTAIVEGCERGSGENSGCPRKLTRANRFGRVLQLVGTAVRAGGQVDPNRCRQSKLDGPARYPVLAMKAAMEVSSTLVSYEQASNARV